MLSTDEWIKKTGYIYIHTHTQWHIVLRAGFNSSAVSDSVTPWTIACQAPMSMGILQAIILELVAMPSSRGSSQPKGQTQVFYIAGGFFTV